MSTGAGQSTEEEEGSKGSLGHDEGFHLVKRR